jgi:hypothetical protein
MAFGALSILAPAVSIASRTAGSSEAKTRLNDQSAKLDLSARVRPSLRGGHTSPMHVGPDKQWTALRTSSVSLLFERCNS